MVTATAAQPRPASLLVRGRFCRVAVMDSNQRRTTPTVLQTRDDTALTCTNGGCRSVLPGTCHGQLATPIDVHSRLDTAPVTSGPGCAAVAPPSAEESSPRSQTVPTRAHRWPLRLNHTRGFHVACHDRQ